MNGHPASESANSEADVDKQHVGESPPPNTTTRESIKQESSDPNRGTKPPKHDRYDRVHLWVLIFGLIAACAAAWEARRLADLTDKLVSEGQKTSQQQAELTRESNKINRDALVASSRAWVGPRNAQIEGSPSIDKPLNVIIEYHNTGREPALSFIYDIDSFSVTAAEDTKGKAHAKLLGYLKKCRAVENWEGGSVIYPTTGFTSYNLTIQTKKEVIDDAVIHGDKSLIVQGCFLYKTFNSVRHSYFCYFYKAGVSKTTNLNICPSGHYAD